ncbi:hypothetical protein AURDEDRAFT_115883, partial [Auricularia subglabra TFB-10046 SS5]
MVASAHPDTVTSHPSEREPQSVLPAKHQTDMHWLWLTDSARPASVPPSPAPASDAGPPLGMPVRAPHPPRPNEPGRDAPRLRRLAPHGCTGL